MILAGEWPAVVRQYDGDRREVRVEIPGLADGAEELPVAQIRYPIGDKSHHTEIRILDGDPVWIVFERGDPRRPIITGYRNPNEGNVVKYRRFHHENIETDADETQKHTAGKTYTVDAGTDINIKAGSTMTLEAGTSITLKVGGSTIVIDSSTITVKSGLVKLN